MTAFAKNTAAAHGQEMTGNDPFGAEAPNGGGTVWVFGGHFAEPTLRAADGSCWRSAIAAGLGRPTHWHPEIKPFAPADALDTGRAA
ncbi:hypothetical protein MKK88_20600 [Methylobacterium sp. E-005]|uniref:hypothetical protein n=1 Tax=Methylobacterium sp. E-005 TaxID=2836549 RepID=UPI001FBA45C1|nr:hypothetical protein [Methylobacterium sp. E-005]MCJ2088367.1 hypothetical protein [Methylobacterium sp. E-005]